MGRLGQLGGAIALFASPPWIRACDCYAEHVLSLFTYNCFTKKNAYFGAYCIIFACVVLLFVNGRYWAVLRMLKYMNIS